MKRFHLLVYLVLALLVVTAIPAAASPSISRISPASAPNTGDVTVTITGTGFNDQSTVWLRTPYAGDSDIYGTIVSWSPTSITCTFPLNSHTPVQYDLWVNSPFTAHGTYFAEDVAVLRDALKLYPGTVVAATTTTSAVTPPSTPVPGNGNIVVSSFPSGAHVYIDNVYKGLTPLTIENVENGRHTVLVRLTGYRDWTTNVVIYGDSETLSAKLVFITPTTLPTTVPTGTAPPTATVRKTVSPLGMELGIMAIMGAAVLLIKRK